MLRTVMITMFLVRRMLVLSRTKFKLIIIKRFKSVIFYGSDQFSLSSLRLLHDNMLMAQGEAGKCVTSLQVICTQLNNNVVANYAKSMDLPCFKWPYRFEQADIGIVVSFGRLISSEDIDACKHGILNVHASLLPRWRGGSPIQHAVLNDDKEFGVTIMKIKPNKFDVGEILCQESILAQQRPTSKQIYNLLAIIGANLMLNCIQNLEYYLKLGKPQPKLGSLAPKLKPSDGQICWSKMTIEEVDRRFRAFDGFINLYTHWTDGRILNLFEMLDPALTCNISLDNSQILVPVPGLVFYHKKEKILLIRCCDGHFAGFKSVKLKGKRKISAMQFYNGFLSRRKSDDVPISSAVLT